VSSYARSAVRTLVVLILLLFLTACATRARRTGTLPPPVTTTALGPGDRFELLVVGEEKLPKEYRVAPDGTVDFAWIGRQNVAGLEPQALQVVVREELIKQKYLERPAVLVNVKEFNSKRITLGGQVAKTGDIPYTPGLTLYRVIASSGGFTNLANRDNVLVTRKVPGGTKTVSFSVDDISEGRAADVPLQAGDSIYVYERNF
jgi:protein involved in polysaccharide export with SLBB domain